MSKETILLCGSNGQLGTVLRTALGEKYGFDNIIASDIRAPQDSSIRFELLDILNKSALAEIIKKNKVTQVYNLAAILSASGESKPMLSWDVNVKGYLNILEVCRLNHVSKIFFPSSIAVFGSDAQKKLVPQYGPLNPETVYGIGKLAGEQWSHYYHLRYGMDIRSIRFPGVIGYESMPGGGTTDYAVEIFHEALRHKKYTCFLKEDSYLPMIYMRDCINSALKLMDAESDQIKVRTSYNLSGMSFSPKEIASSIQRHIPEFEINYEPDFRQKIADSWVHSIDDDHAQKDWGWKAQFDLDKLVDDMILNLSSINSTDLKKNKLHV